MSVGLGAPLGVRRGRRLRASPHDAVWLLPIHLKGFFQWRIKLTFKMLSNFKTPFLFLFNLKSTLQLLVCCWQNGNLEPLKLQHRPLTACEKKQF